MVSLSKMIKTLEEYAEKSGVSPDIIMRRATNNPYLYKRLKKAADYQEEVTKKVFQYIEENPVDASDE